MLSNAPISDSSTDRVRFGPFTLDVLARALTRGAERLALEPRAFDTLAYLVKHHQRVVGKDELISAVWGRVDASDQSVIQAVARVRRALAEHAEWIETRPRVGYRFTASLAPWQADPEPPAAPPRAARARRWPWFVAALLGAAVWISAWQWPSPAPLAAPRSIELAPFRGSAEAPRGLAALLKESIQHYAPRGVELHVPSAEAAPNPRAFARLETRLEATATGWQIDGELHRGRQSTPLPRVVEATVEGVLQRYAGRVATQLDPGVVRPDAPARLSHVQTRALALEARWQGDVATARALLLRIPERERQQPEIALEWAAVACAPDGARASCDALLAELNRRALPPALKVREALLRGRVQRERGRLDDADAALREAQTLLGAEGDGLLRASVLHTLGMVAFDRGAFDQARAHNAAAATVLLGLGERARYAALANNNGAIAAMQGDYEEALTTFEQARAAFAEFNMRGDEALALANLAEVQGVLGRKTLALRTAERAVALDPPALAAPRAQLALARAALDVGDSARATAALAQAEALAPESLRAPRARLRAALAAQRGDHAGERDALAALLTLAEPRDPATHALDHLARLRRADPAAQAALRAEISSALRGSEPKRAALILAYADALLDPSAAARARALAALWPQRHQFGWLQEDLLSDWGDAALAAGSLDPLRMALERPPLRSSEALVVTRLRARLSAADS